MPWLAAPRAAMAALGSRGAHALLLHGPAGIGKWALAMDYAADALCERPGAGGRRCGACASCALFAAGNHPDLRVVVPDAFADRRPAGGAEDPDSVAAEPDEAPAAGKGRPSREIKIEQVRDLAVLTGMTTHRGGARVIVLGPAESLNGAAANALLKSLEEPPPDSLYLLVSDRIDRCLPTIVSRCALVRMAVPARAQALDWLAAQGLGEGAALKLAEAGGAPLAALEPAGEELPEETRLALTSMLRRGPALEPAQVAAGVPRTVTIAPAVVLFQRWVWDFFSYCMGATLRYHPQDAGHFDALARVWSLRAAGAWWDGLRELRAVSDHPLNGRAAVEGALLEYVRSIAALRAER